MTDFNKIESNDIFLDIVEQQEDKFLIKISCDDIWLSDEARVYPVIIDPNYKDKEINSYLNNKGKYELYNTCNEEGYSHVRLVFFGLPNQLIKVKWSPDYFPEEGVLVAGKGNCKDINLGTITLPYWIQGDYYKGDDSSVYIDLSNSGNFNIPITVKIFGCNCLNGEDSNKSYFHGYIDSFYIYTGYKYELYNKVFEDGCSSVCLKISSSKDNIVLNNFVFSPDFCPEAGVKIAGNFFPGEFANSPNMNVMFFNQYALGLPTGCEITTAAMLVNQYYKTNPIQLLSYLKIGGVLGNDPNRIFIGDPRYSSGYGCYSTPIAEAINKFFSNNKINYKGIAQVGYSLDYFAMNYIEKGKAVAIWVTMNMVQSEKRNNWIAHEHCLLLTGSDSLYYYLNDPMQGRVKYPKWLVQKRYEEMGKHAVVIEISKNITPNTNYKTKIKPIVNNIKNLEHKTNNNIKSNCEIPSYKINNNYCFNYDRNKAFNYMKKYAEKRKNPIYFDFNLLFSGNCANFVSQCLVAGGFHQTEKWHYNPNFMGKTSLNTFILTLSKKLSTDEKVKKRLEIATASWSAAKDHYEYWKTMSVFPIQEITSEKDIVRVLNESKNSGHPIQVGDLLYFVKKNKKNKIVKVHHATIIFAVKNDNIIYSSNTKDKLEGDLKEFLSDKKNKDIVFVVILKNTYCI